MKRILYTGLEVPESLKPHVIHYPLIKITPRPKHDPAVTHALSQLSLFTDIIFTSKTSVDILSQYAPHDIIKNHRIFSVGAQTTKRIIAQKWPTPITATTETAEGITHLLSQHNLSNSYLFWPHSALSRPLITDWLNAHHIKHLSTIFYDTSPITPPQLFPLDECDEVHFTSPSTVDAFFSLYTEIPKHVALIPIGPVTAERLAGGGGALPLHPAKGPWPFGIPFP